MMRIILGCSVPEVAIGTRERRGRINQRIFIAIRA
jgi:hypothetical protein